MSEQNVNRPMMFLRMMHRSTINAPARALLLTARQDAADSAATKNVTPVARNGNRGHAAHQIEMLTA